MDNPDENLLIAFNTTNKGCSVQLRRGNGNVVKSYLGGGPCRRRGLHVVGGGETVLMLQETAHVLKLWKACGQSSPDSLKLQPGAKVLDISEYYTLLAVGIETKLYVWNLSSGDLLSVTKRNVRDITCLRFCEEHLIVADEDGVVQVYNVGDLISGHCTIDRSGSSSPAEPLYTIQEGGILVRDLVVSKFGNKSRFITVGSNNYVRIYQLSDGTPLLAVPFPTSNCVVEVDATFQNIFLGDATGKVIRFGLSSPPRGVEHPVVEPSDTHVFKDHTGAITCISINRANTLLATGSSDSTVKMWSLSTAKLVHTIACDTPVTNVFFVPSFIGFDVESSTRRFQICKSLNHAVSSMKVRLLQSENLEFVASEPSNIFVNEEPNLELIQVVDELYKRARNHFKSSAQNL